MRILFYQIAELANLSDSMTQAEYLNDSLFHGFKSLFGADVVDNYRFWHMYRDADRAKLGKLHGRGFTLYGLLDEGATDRSDLDSKIRNRYFDLVIMPVHCTVARQTEGDNRAIAKAVNYIGTYYKPEEIAFMDGLDQQTICQNVRGRVTYFKRELNDNREEFHPICYSVPQEKLVGPLKKTKLLADYKPGMPYQYTSEADYYKGYQEAQFAQSQRRGGWDCLRHYEILACGCIPYFPTVVSCPARTLFRFPKGLCQTLPAWDDKNDDIVEKMMEHTKKFLTTESIASYVLDTMCH